MTDSGLKLQDAVNQTCAWSGQPITENALTLYKGRTVGFCNSGCRDKFEHAVDHFEAALQNAPEA